jgi:hypothetical protein
MKKTIAYVSVLLAAFISGCATTNLPVETSVSVFHAMPVPTGVKYTMLPYKEQEGGLEYRTYAQAVSDEFKKVGMIEVGPSEAAFAVFIRYGIDNGREVISSYPIIGQTGVASSSTYGTATHFGNTSTLNATTVNTPTFGVVGSGSRSDTVYRRYLDLEIVEMSSLNAGTRVVKVYEGKARSEGSLNQLPTIMPPMIQSIFKEFPGQSGKSRKHSIILPPEPRAVK